MESGEASVALLSGFGAAWPLSEPVLIREGQRARVYRCRSHAPEFETVILKQITDEGACGFTDWAGLRFLEDTPAAHGLVPRFLAGDGAQRAYLIEDLGGSRSLDTVLAGRDPNALTTALGRLAQAYGKLHAITIGGETQFARLRQSLPEAAGHGRHAEAERWREALPKITGWGEALGIGLAKGFEAAAHLVAETYAEPGPFLAFTHGDPAPSNNHVSDDAVRLLDFEYGAYRHCLYDLTAWYVLCPLDELIVQVMQDTYRQVLRPTIPEIGDDHRFQYEWALLCAYRVLAMLTWIPPSVLERNYPWADNWTAREGAFVALRRLARACDGIEPLSPILVWAENAEGAFRLRFPELEDALPHWPVFDTISPVPRFPNA